MPSSKWLTVFKPKSRSRSQSISLPLPHKPSRKTLSFASRSARHVSFVKIGRRWLSVVTLGTYTYQGRPRQNSDVVPTFPSGDLGGGKSDGRAWRARSMSMPETPTRIDGDPRARREFWVSRLETIDDCTLNSKKSHDSRQSFDCRAVAGRRIKTHSWFDRLDEEVAAEVSARDAELEVPLTPPSHDDDQSSFVPLSPRQTVSPMAIRGYASTGEIENWDDAYDFEDAEDDWVDIPTPQAPTFGVSARAR
ncbi:hypothetical protein GGF50DRAFT_61114 [Schizophyllum commune]